MENIIGYKIRKIREMKNLSQKYMANKLSVSQSHYSDIENCKVQVSEKKLKNIANVLEVSLEILRNFNDHILFNNDVQSSDTNTYQIQIPIEKIENLYNEIIKVKDEYILHLKETIMNLKSKLNECN